AAHPRRAPVTHYAHALTGRKALALVFLHDRQELTVVELDRHLDAALARGALLHRRAGHATGDRAEHGRDGASAAAADGAARDPADGRTGDRADRRLGALELDLAHALDRAVVDRHRTPRLGALVGAAAQATGTAGQQGHCTHHHHHPHPVTHHHNSSPKDSLNTRAMS